MRAAYPPARRAAVEARTPGRYDTLADAGPFPEVNGAFPAGSAGRRAVLRATRAAVSLGGR